MTKKMSTEHANFLKNKEEIAKKMELTIYSELQKMGNDVKGITWFSALSHEYIGNKSIKAA